MRLNSRYRREQTGLTFLEVVIILLVLATVAYITYPKFVTLLHQSHEGHTKANLGDIRGALAIYYSDNFGLYPSDEGTPENRLVSSLTPHYIKEIPPVELPHYYPVPLNTVQDRLNDKGDWVYYTLNGFMTVNSFLNDTSGEPFSKW